VTNDKLQGSVAAHLRCGVLFRYHLTLHLSLTLVVKTILKSAYMVKLDNKVDFLVCPVRLAMCSNNIYCKFTSDSVSERIFKLVSIWQTPKGKSLVSCFFGYILFGKPLSYACNIHIFAKSCCAHLTFYSILFYTYHSNYCCKQHQQQIHTDSMMQQCETV